MYDLNFFRWMRDVKQIYTIDEIMESHDNLFREFTEYQYEKELTKYESEESVTYSDIESAECEIECDEEREDLCEVIQNKKKEYIEYFESHKVFKNFLKLINGLQYLNADDLEKRYTKKDIEYISVKSHFEKEEDILINIEEFLVSMYKYLNTKKTSKEMCELLKKYQEWYYVMIQRVYKKYIKKNYNVKNINDSDCDIVIIGGYCVAIKC